VENEMLKEVIEEMYPCSYWIQTLTKDMRGYGEYTYRVLGRRRISLVHHTNDYGDAVQYFKHCLMTTWIHEPEEKVKIAAALLERIVCTEGEDAGVILLDHEGTTHTEEIDGRKVSVYDHAYFSPLGDALIALHKTLKQ
jgi:hypothetical protein